MTVEVRMSTAVLAPPLLPPPPPVKFTVEEFNQMGDMGWFEGRRPILIDGIIRQQGAMSPSHATGLGLVDIALRSAFTTGWVIRPQLPLHLDQYNDPLPDFAVIPVIPEAAAAGIQRPPISLSKSRIRLSPST
jgi:hypothetical protein